MKRIKLSSVNIRFYACLCCKPPDVWVLHDAECGYSIYSEYIPFVEEFESTCPSQS